MRSRRWLGPGVTVVASTAVGVLMVVFSACGGGAGEDVSDSERWLVALQTVSNGDMPMARPDADRIWSAMPDAVDGLAGSKHSSTFQNHGQERGTLSVSYGQGPTCPGKAAAQLSMSDATYADRPLSGVEQVDLTVGIGTRDIEGIGKQVLLAHDDFDGIHWVRYRTEWKSSWCGKSRAPGYEDAPYRLEWLAWAVEGSAWELSVWSETPAMLDAVVEAFAAAAKRGGPE